MRLDIARSTPLKLKVGGQESDVPVNCSQIVVETPSRSLIKKIRNISGRVPTPSNEVCFESWRLQVLPYLQDAGLNRMSYDLL